jgi:acyl-CoA synthetase (AMP-forming)/AMP-acid ligase II
MAITSQRFGVETLGIREGDVFYSEAKLFFAYGLGNNLTFPLWVGATAVLNEHRPGPATSFPLIKRFRPTLYFGVPTLYAAYLQHFAHALAYNLANFMRTLALPEAVKQWSLTSLREKLVKIGAKVVRHGRYVIFQMAEVAVPKELFQEILRLIDGLRPKPAPA